MNKISGNLDIYKYNILPFIGLKIFKINYFRSVCKEFGNYIRPIKTKHIIIPSNKYPTIKSAYLTISDYISKKISSKKYKFIIPEIWLKKGTYINTLFEFNYPISIRGCNKDMTIIKNGLLYKIKWDLWNHEIKINDLSIINRNSVNDYYEAGINYMDCIGNSKIVIKNCKIFNCIGTGIKCPGGNIKIYNSEIYNNNNIGIHLHGKNINFKLKDLDIHNNKDGIVIGKLYKEKKYIVENIRSHHNLRDGLSIGGCSSKGIVVICGDKTDISYNALDKHSYSAGISTNYEGGIWIVDLHKNISHDNYNKQDYLSRFNSKILFKYC